MAVRILDGLTVLEVGRGVAAPYCGKLLADHGAEVIKLEEPGVGDPARRLGPFPGDRPHPERSAVFLYLNTNKRSITLDLRGEAGRHLFERLVSELDVLIEDWDETERARIGLDYEGLAVKNPRLVVTSITPFGLTGPERGYRAHPINLYHASGQTSFGYAAHVDDGRPPAKGAGFLTEYDAGLTAAVGTLGAVLSALATGRGQQVDVSKLEALMGLERVDIGRLTNDPNPQRWRGGIGGMLKAKDGYLMLTAAQAHQFRGVLRAMGEPDWVKPEWLEDEMVLQEHREEIQPHIEAWAAGLTRDELYHRLQAEGAAAGPVRTASEVRESEQVSARGFFAPIAHPEAGTLSYPTLPHLLSGDAGQMRPDRAAPLLGEHNEEVYCGRLGYRREELAALAAAGVIG
jgi:crotonobetainyl-CoA:carnitine CoA-transferase CaiB-like acyl-CoA transferase